MQRFVSGTITKNNFVIPAKSTAKESDILRVVALFRPFLYAVVFKIEMSALPECFMKIQQI